MATSRGSVTTKGKDGYPTGDGAVPEDMSRESPARGPRDDRSGERVQLEK